MVLSNGFFYERIQLDTINERFNKVPTAKEGDANGRGMIVVLTENGLVKNTTGVSLLFKWEHTRIAGAQGLEDFEPLDLTKGEYIVTYPTEMNHEGYVKAEIRIIENGKYAGSRNMKIQVEPSVGDDTAMESSNQFSALVTALIKTNHMENLLNEAIANVTVDSEVITARNSTAKQKTFTVLDERMEDLEKDVYYPANNELTQADFAATTGWSVYQGTLAVANKIASVTGTSGLYPNVYQDINCEVGDKLYYAAQARVTTAGAAAIALRSEGVEITTDNARVLTPVANQWYQLDCIKTAFETTPSFAVSQRYALAADATGKVLQVKKPIALNLTKIFGANAIPTIEQIRAILSRFTDSHFVGNEGLSQPALLMGKALSLEAQFNAAVAGLTVDDETINARVGKDNTTHATLKARLDSEKSTIDQSLVSLGSQLAHIENEKADLSYVDAKTNSLASGSPKGVYATLALLQAAYPTGNANVYVVSADGKWYYWSGSAWISGGAYLSEVSVATNFEMHKQTDGVLDLIRGVDLTWTEGQVLVASTGMTSTSGAYNASLHGVTGFFDVSGYTHISALILRNYGLDIAALVFYDALNAIISSYTQNSTQDDIFRLVPIPVGAVKAKYSYYADVRADALTRARFSYLKNVNTDSLRQKQDVALADIEALQNKYVSTDNLFDKSAITVGRELQPYNIVDNADYGYTDFIPASTGETLYAMGCSVSSSVGYIYDSSKTKLNYKVFNFTANNANLISELNVAYVRFNVKTSDLATFFLRKQKVVRYEPYKQLPFNEIKNFNNGQLNFWQDKNMDSLGDSLTGQGLYQKYVRQYFNLAKFSNHGIGGTKLSGASNEFGASMWEDSRIDALDVDADGLVWMGGANDGVAAIGALTLENYDTNTIAGALNVMISKIYYKYQKLSAGYYTGITYTGVTQVATAKNILIFLCTPFYMPSESDPYRVKNIAHAIREIGKLWGLPVMDTAAKSMLNDGVKDVYWGTDRTHPLEPAYRDRIAPVMIGEMEQFKPVDYTKAYYI